MTDRIDVSSYDHAFALDTQMVFEARPLAQLDWSSLSQGPILLAILLQVSAEVDARKRDGHLGQRVVAAEHVTVEFRSGNAVLDDGPYWVDVFGPPPPSTESDFLTNIPRLSNHLARTDRASFELEEAEDPDIQIEYRCQDFRHGRSQALTAVIEPVERTGQAAHIEIRVTASNMRGEVVERLIVPVADIERNLGDLIDLDDLQFREAPPVWDLLVPIIEEDENELTRFRNDGSQRE